MTTPTLDTPHAQPKTSGSKRIQGGLLDPKMLLKALPDALRKLNPRTLWRNPVMFIVEIGAVWSTILAIADPSWFSWLTVIWLWLTVIFANVAEAVAEGRGKAQAESLRKTKPARPSPVTVMWWKASPRWTSPRSPASPHRSSASPAATVVPSPAAPPCCR